MTNTAQDYQTSSCATTEGLDELFQPGPAQAVASHTPEAVADPSLSGASLDEASRLLNLHVDTIKKRLRKGTLKGFKVQEKYGDKWFVSAEELPGSTQAVADLTLEAVADPTLLSPALERLVSSLEKKDAVIESQVHQLKAAGDVIMYLKTQLEEKDTQLKLLTDSRHKASWWAKFSSWFFRGQ